ncbi:MAG: hypothetical protein ACYC5F_07745, partial [Thermoleophilia bacterium]
AGAVAGGAVAAGAVAGGAVAGCGSSDQYRAGSVAGAAPESASPGAAGPMPAPQPSGGIVTQRSCFSRGERGSSRGDSPEPLGAPLPDSVSATGYPILQAALDSRELIHVHIHSIPILAVFGTSSQPVSARDTGSRPGILYGSPGGR